jgi:2-dehydro-3-deoxygalactonokinase
MGLATSYFLSCDWGTTAFRLRLVEATSGRVLDSVATDDGANAINRRLGSDADGDRRAAAFADHLGQAVSRMLAGANLAKVSVPVVVSGMASSSIGWRELPYASLPFSLTGADACVARLDLALEDGSSLPVLLVSGVAGDDDMMRGEETQLLGLFAGRPADSRGSGLVVILPGTHSKHVHIEAGKVVSLQTYMTGELFQVLTQHSVLRFTTTADTPVGEPGFSEGVRAVRERGLSRVLFQARSRGVLHGQRTDHNRDFLCGALIGDELAQLAARFTARRVILAAGDPMAEFYLRVAQLAGLGDVCTSIPPGILDRLALEGHAVLLRRFEEQMR